MIPFIWLDIPIAASLPIALWDLPLGDLVTCRRCHATTVTTDATGPICRACHVAGSIDELNRPVEPEPVEPEPVEPEPVEQVEPEPDDPPAAPSTCYWGQGRDDWHPPTPSKDAAPGSGPQPAKPELSSAAEAPTARSPRAKRKPSGYYVNMATDGARLLVAAEGGPLVVDLTAGTVGELVDTARAHAGTHDVILWADASAAEVIGPLPVLISDYAARLDAAGLPAVPMGDGAIKLTAPGAPAVLLHLPHYSGDLAGLDAADLLDAVELWRTNVGLALAFSAPSTGHQLVESWHRYETDGTSHKRRGRTKRPGPEPELSPPVSRTAWSVPRHAWKRPLTEAERQGAYVRAFDRNGSYLSAWTGCALPAGEWRHEPGPFPVEPMSEARRPSGYWLLDLAALDLPADLPNPFDRLATSAPQWYTTPLAQLAAELAAAAGVPLAVRDAWVTSDHTRALDGPAQRLRDAKAAFQAVGTVPALAAADLVKEGYSGGTNWFSLKGRPSWTVTVLDRYAANTYRGLAKAQPFAVAMIDTALFVVDGPEAVPAGLEVSDRLGKWKAAGHAVPMAEAGPLIDAGNLWGLLGLVGLNVPRKGTK